MPQSIIVPYIRIMVQVHKTLKRSKWKREINKIIITTITFKEMDVNENISQNSITVDKNPLTLGLSLSLSHTQHTHTSFFFFS